ncbi:MAG TPA: hypothetical protein VN783_04955 [Thermoanaerobaculia bacterium]|nr:hypothetical protein [Thermoanaerobaculia bacterium]
MQHLQPQMAQILARYRIPVEDAERILEELFLTLHLKRETITQPDRWLLSSLKNRCLIFWRSRREQFCRALDLGLLSMLSSPEVPASERADARVRIAALSSRLSASCRQRIERRYGLADADGICEPEERLDPEMLRCLIALSRRMVNEGALAPEARDA